jgi:hypothetical protein
MILRRAFFLSVLVMSSLSLNAQKGVATFGLQYKPIIPNRFIGTFEEDFSAEQMTASIRQKIGHSFGGVVRYGFTDNLSFETGINLTHRNFGLNFAIPDSSFAGTGDVSVVSYEVPVSCLVYIRLGDQLFMNTSLGAALTMFTSDVSVPVTIPNGDYFLMEGAYKSKVQGAFIANFGFEYRTRKSGYFYLGTSYHLPFAPIMTMALSYEYSGGDVVSIQNVRGSYLTLDLRYFFNERPEK